MSGRYPDITQTALFGRGSRRGARGIAALLGQGRHADKRFPVQAEARFWPLAAAGSGRHPVHQRPRRPRALRHPRAAGVRRRRGDRVADLPRNHKGARMPVTSFKPAWQKQCITGPKGRILPILANALDRAARGAGTVRHRRLRRNARPADAEGAAGRRGFPMRPLTDADVGIIQDWMQHSGISQLGRDITFQARRHGGARKQLPSRPRLSRPPRMGRRAAALLLAGRLSRRHRNVALRLGDRPDVPDLDGGADLPAGLQVRLHDGA